jgi:hypothetical protein
MADIKPLADVDSANISVLEQGADSLNSPGTFNVYRYPQDLATEQHPHYMMFFITVRKADASGVELATGSDGKQINFDYSQSNRVPAGGVATGAYAVTSGVSGGIAGGEQLAKIPQQLTSSTTAGAAASTAIAGTTKTVAAGLGTAALVAQSVGREQVLLKDAIALYVNKNPSASYAAGWADEDLGIIGGIGEQLKGIGSAGLAGGVEKILAGIGGAAGAFALQNAPKDLGGLGNAGGAFSASAGIAVNPFKAQLFKSMGFREFTYDYIFLPKNIQEYKEVKNIIRTFKKYMHPSLGIEKFLMSYPAEFTIAFYYKENVSEELFRISNCALINMSVEYGGSDFATFRDREGINGAPSEIALKLTFKELELLTQNRIDSGF